MMSTVAMLALAAGVAGAEPALPDGADVWNSKEIAWRKLGDGLAEAKRDGKVALVVVHATWCGVCTEYRALFKDKRVIAASRKVAMILVDMDNDKEGMKPFDAIVDSVPSTLVVDDKAKVLIEDPDPEYRNYVDPSEPDELLTLLKQAHALRSEASNSLERPVRSVPVTAPPEGKSD